MTDRQEEPATERPRHVIDRTGLVWRVVRDGGMATRADYTGQETIGMNALRSFGGPLIDLEAEREAQGEQPAPLDWMMLWRMFQLHSYMPRDSMMGLAEACTCKGWLSPGMGSDGVSWDEHLTAEYASLSNQPSTEPAQGGER